MDTYKDSQILELIIHELKDKDTYRASAQRARAKCFPKLPKSHKDIDLDKIGLKHLELGRSSDFANPEVENKDIILLGTPTTAEAWARSEFKSGDGTFKICPKEFYQVIFYSILSYELLIDVSLGFCLDGSLWGYIPALFDWITPR